MIIDSKLRIMDCLLTYMVYILN